MRILNTLIETLKNTPGTIFRIVPGVLIMIASRPPDGGSVRCFRSGDLRAPLAFDLPLTRHLDDSRLEESGVQIDPQSGADRVTAVSIRAEARDAAVVFDHSSGVVPAIGSSSKPPPAVAAIPRGTAACIAALSYCIRCRLTRKVFVVIGIAKIIVTYTWRKIHFYLIDAD